MSSAPQVQTQEISDADLDNVSGGVFVSLTGEVSPELPPKAPDVSVDGTFSA